MQVKLRRTMMVAVKPVECKTNPRYRAVEQMVFIELKKR
jgi:hypothetical protein